MRPSYHTKLTRALERQRIPADKAREIINDVFSPASTLLKTVKAETAFDNIIANIRAAKRSVTSNRTKWVPALVPLYEDYLAVLDRTINDVRDASALMLKDPDDPKGTRVPATLERITAIAAKRNAHARQAGQFPGPSCTANWVSWVDPNECHRIILAFDQAYTLMQRGQGRRFIPFSTASLAKDTHRGIHRHRAFIEAQRTALADRPNGKGSTHYRALHLCALRMAELWLDGYERALKTKHRHPATDPIPVHWMHLLTSDMRQRVRDADADPSQPIDPTGLGSFYEPQEPEK